jgi:hypothetical protein
MSESYRELLEKIEEIFIIGLLLGMIYRALKSIKKGGSELAPPFKERPDKKSGGA